MWRKLVLSLAFLFVSMAGCQYLSPIGPIIQLGIYWYEGEAHKYYQADQKTVRSALLETLKELNISVSNEEVKGNVIYIRAGGKVAGEGKLGLKDQQVSLDDRFKIKVTAVNNRVSKLSIRVNIFGDKPYAELIYRTVDRKQGIKVFKTLEELNTAVR